MNLHVVALLPTKVSQVECQVQGREEVRQRKSGAWAVTAGGPDRNSETQSAIREGILIPSSRAQVHANQSRRRHENLTARVRCCLSVCLFVSLFVCLSPLVSPSVSYYY